MTRSTLLLLATLCGPPCLRNARYAPWSRSECVTVCAPALAACRLRHGWSPRPCRRILLGGCRHLGAGWCWRLCRDFGC